MDNPHLTSAHWRQEVYRLIALKDAKQRNVEKLQQELLDVTAQIHNADGRFTQAELHEQTLQQMTKELVAENKKIKEMLEESKRAQPQETVPPKPIKQKKAKPLPQINPFKPNAPLK